MNARAKDGTTPAHGAAAGGNTAALEVLAAHGADMKARAEDGYTPALKAAYGGHAAALKFLAAHGADLNATGLKDTVPERPYHSNLCTSEFH